MPNDGAPAAPDLALLADIARDSPAPMLVLGGGAAQRVLLANRAFCAAAGGLDAAALLARSAREALPPLAEAGWLRVLEAVRARGRRLHRHAVAIPLRDGAPPEPWDVELCPLGGRGGAAHAILVHLRPPRAAAVVAGVAAGLAAGRRDGEAVAAAQAALMRTAEHRIKNSLQLVASLLRLQAGRGAAPEVRTALEAAVARVQAVAEAHRALQRSPDMRRVRVADVLEELAAGATVLHPGADLRVEAPEPRDLGLDADLAIPLALVLSELVTGALAACGGAGPVRLSARGEDGGGFAVRIGGAACAAAPGAGREHLSDTVVRALARQIGAEVAAEDGAAATVVRVPGRGG